MAAADALAAPYPPCAHQDCSGGQTGAVPALSEDNGKEHGVGVNPWVSSGSLHLGPSLNVGPGPFTGAVCAGGASLWLPQLPHACPLGTSRALCPAPGRALPTAPPGMDVGRWGRCPRASAGLWELQLGPGTCQQPFENKPKKPQHNKRQNVLVLLLLRSVRMPDPGRAGAAGHSLAGHWQLLQQRFSPCPLLLPPAVPRGRGCR